MATMAPDAGEAVAQAAPVTAGAPPRYRRNRRSEIAIWWQEIDRPLLFLVVTLMAIGSVAVAAGSPASARRLSTAHEKLSDLHFFWMHLVWQGLGVGALLFAARLTKDQARRCGILIAGAMLAALVLVPFVGSEVNGARRWLNLGMSLQPSQFLEAGFPILLAWILSWKARDPRIPVLWLCVGIMGLVAVLLMAQPDFGTTMLLGGTWFVMILLAGISVRLIGMLAGAGVGLVVLMYFTYENGRNRIDAFLGGGQAFDQVDLAQRTLLNGGWTGTGFWMGQRKFALPEAHTDYIFSVIGEEFGLLACLVIVMIYLALLARILLRLVREDDLFSVLAAAGLAAQFGGQAFINILVNLQLFPSKGMTLPLISYGGSSTVATCLCLGFLIAITRRNPYLPAERFSLSEVGALS